MLHLIYISHLHPGTQKTLAYALGLAKAFSAPLSILPSTSLGDPASSRQISIWSPKRGMHDRRVDQVTNIYRSRKGNLPLYILGKPSQLVKSNYQSYQIIQQLVDLGAPLLLLPFAHTFQGIRRILFARNAPGLTDHKVKQLIAANFLPQVFKMEGPALTRIHWNNISHIPNHLPIRFDFSCSHLDASLQEHEIDLTICPVDLSDRQVGAAEWQSMVSTKHPLLLLPLKSNSDHTQHSFCETTSI